MAIVKAMNTLNIGYGHADQQVEAAGGGGKLPGAVFKRLCGFMAGL